MHLSEGKVTERTAGSNGTCQGHFWGSADSRWGNLWACGCGWECLWAQGERVQTRCPSARPPPPPRVPPESLTPAQELRHAALPPQGGAAELVVQPQQQIQEAVESRAAAGLAPHQLLQRTQPPLHGSAEALRPD